MTLTKAKIALPPRPKTADQFVAAGAATAAAQPEALPSMRMTIDIDEPLHRAFKTHCAAEGLKMRDVMTQLVRDYVAAKAAKKA
jgi:hypothetical protein